MSMNKSASIVGLSAVAFPSDFCTERGENTHGLGTEDTDTSRSGLALFYYD